MIYNGDNHKVLSIRGTKGRRVEVLQKRMLDTLGFTFQGMEIAELEAVPAIVNYGRWIARCPFCPGSEIVFKSFLFFMCHSCWNEESNHKFVEIVWPDDANKIEQILDKRNEEENRGWEAYESLNELNYQNITHGFGVA